MEMERVLLLAHKEEQARGAEWLGHVSQIVGVCTCFIIVLRRHIFLLTAAVCFLAGFLPKVTSEQQLQWITCKTSELLVCYHWGIYGKYNM